jgi:valyl-tRNA synthetase
VKELARAYEPKDIEQRTYAWWMERGLFTPDAADPRPPYCIVIPPPNVTGYLHVGHALVNTLQDVLIRRKRMQGFSALWLPGTDHAGISTQLVVARKLADEGKDRRAMGRDAFLEETWRWRELHGNGILHQLQKLGSSCDWTRTRFTMDEGLSHAVRKVFVDLHAKDLIYRGPYMVAWCPSCSTALSDLENEHEEVDGTLWRLAYPLADGSGEVVVATTRPETMLGDTAVAVSPDDPRHAHLVGRTVRLPLVDRDVPVIADAHVDPAFGTGCVKVTPAHDPNDWEMGRRHGLPLVQVIGPDGSMTLAAGSFAGLPRFEARRRVLDALAEAGLRRGEQPHRHAVGHCQRCHSVSEPLVSTQWFMRMRPLADRAIEVVEDGRLRILPDQYRKVYLSWMRDIRDWCISRQLWWGHRIPAWHCAACAHVSVSLRDVTACHACGSTAVTQDEDVLDTWFSAALWPFSTLGWPDRRAADLRRWYPTSVLVTGFDILFFWVARMVMLGLECMDEVPFHDVFMHGLVRDERGEKMSKMKGNVIDPLEVIEHAGADALRFTLAILAVPARDIPWNPRRMEGYRTFANKLWQAARFVQMNLGDTTSREWDPARLALPDRWILSRLAETARSVNEALDEYRFHEAADAIYHFAWDELCAWYIEMAKPALQATEGALAAEAETRRRVLLAVLDDTLRLLHPFMPFLTEELWQSLPHEGETIMLAPYPEGRRADVDALALRDMARLQEVVTALRNLRAETGIDPKQRIPVRLECGDAATRRLLADVAPLVASLARTEDVRIAEPGGDRGGCAVAEAGGVTVLVPLHGVLDVEAEKARLHQARGKLEKDLAGLESRLQNPSFVERAKPEVVAEARTRHEELLDRRARLDRALATLSAS